MSENATALTIKGMLVAPVVLLFRGSDTSAWGNPDQKDVVRERDRTERKSAHPPHLPKSEAERNSEHSAAQKGSQP